MNNSALNDFTSYLCELNRYLRNLRSEDRIDNFYESGIIFPVAREEGQVLWANEGTEDEHLGIKFSTIVQSPWSYSGEICVMRCDWLKVEMFHQM